MSGMEDHRAEVARYMARLYERGLTTACGGNVSLRAGDLMYITPSSIDKAAIMPSQVAIIDIASARSLTPDIRVSIEGEMHRQVYLAREDVCAVVHSHPLFASMYSALEEPVETRLIAENCYLLGQVVKAPYDLMGTKELAGSVARCIMEHDVVLMENHGALTVGTSLLTAFERMEVLERAAKMTYLTSGRVHPRPLDDAQVAEIMKDFA